MDQPGERSADKDAGIEAKVAFLKRCRACLRAKLAVWHLDEEDVPDPGRWTASAMEYLGLAEKYGRGLAFPGRQGACPGNRHS